MKIELDETTAKAVIEYYNLMNATRRDLNNWGEELRKKANQIAIGVVLAAEISRCTQCKTPHLFEDLELNGGFCSACIARAES